MYVRVAVFIRASARYFEHENGINFLPGVGRNVLINIFIYHFIETHRCVIVHYKGGHI